MKCTPISVDYSKYELDDLLQCFETIDISAHPDNAIALATEIVRKGGSLQRTILDGPNGLMGDLSLLFDSHRRWQELDADRHDTQIEELKAVLTVRDAQQKAETSNKKMDDTAE